MTQALATIGHRPQRLKMIKDTLQEKAPKTYRDLKKGGKLDQFAEDQEQAMMENYDNEMYRILDRGATSKEKDPLRLVQQMNTAEYQLWNETLETFLDFKDPEVE